MLRAQGTSATVFIGLGNYAKEKKHARTRDCANVEKPEINIVGVGQSLINGPLHRRDLANGESGGWAEWFIIKTTGNPKGERE